MKATAWGYERYYSPLFYNVVGFTFVELLDERLDYPMSDITTWCAQLYLIAEYTA